VSRSRYALAALLYALVMAYSSTFVGVLGPHFVPLDLSEALSRLIHIPYVEHGSDQRSDWIGNVLLLVPLGFLVTGWLSPGKQIWKRISVFSAAGAFVLCFLFILIVKFAQLFFPPRTVTLNYVIAQGLGTAGGIMLFAGIRAKQAQLRPDASPLESLRMVLWIYTAALILFLLMPLDFALSLEDLTAQLDRLPDSFTAISGEGRPLIVRAVVIFGSIVAMMPMGAMLTIVGRGRVYVGRTIGDATWIGFCVMAGVYALTCLVISGSPSAAAIGFRTIGIAIGAWLIHWLTRQNAAQIKWDLERLVPFVVPVYLVTLAAVNGLLSRDWITPARAADDFYIYGLIPLYNYYIVTKPQAAKNIVGHAILYAPIGVMLWLRMKHDGGKAASFAIAASLSAVVEAGRFLRPGLVPDINAIPVAGVGAWAAFTLTPVLWRLLSVVAIGGLAPVPLQPADGAPVMGWRERDVHRRSRRRDRGKVIGDVEDY
jgi:VanZ family protein